MERQQYNQILINLFAKTSYMAASMYYNKIILYNFHNYGSTPAFWTVWCYMTSLSHMLVCLFLALSPGWLQKPFYFMLFWTHTVSLAILWDVLSCIILSYGTHEWDTLCTKLTIPWMVHDRTEAYFVFVYICFLYWWTLILTLTSYFRTTPTLGSYTLVSL